MFWVRNTVKNRSFSGNICIVVLAKAKFYHTIEEQNKTDKKKKAEPNN